MVLDGMPSSSPTCRSPATTSPPRTAVEIDPATVGRLFRDFDNFVAIKETTKDFEHFSRVKYAARDIVMWSGIELLCLPILSLGGNGFISALAEHRPEGRRRPVHRCIDR